ncbi:hypothetical protein J5226_08495 [Lysobacter sp. K5869]|uniref:hypothetical protein n=1 Tax=Lysobacter sp. K5869 TaxID=2820808 RepID=UPI001C06051E|nr:hypothetical protein [Lysobacter sp. K5869]QWP78415.1 hypothetical protein J5226_08495 [Lysobacter sp. K5869]
MKRIFGGAISVILLGVYVHLISLAVRVALCVGKAGCTEYTAGQFNDGMAQALSVIGGLVSALVIAELALSKPGEAPGTRVLDSDASTGTVRTVAIVSVFFVLVWIGTGLTAFLVGLYHPATLPVLTTHGQAWLGLAVSAAYAYFGLQPR